MKSARGFFLITGLATIFSAALFWLFHAYPMMPLAASAEAHYVDHAFKIVLWLSIPIYSLVMAALLYTLFFFRSESRGAEGEKFDQSKGRWVESLWIGASFVLTLGLAAFGSIELQRLHATQKTADLEVNVTASQFSWEFFYPVQQQYSVRLVLPVGKKVRLIFKSSDVIHSFWVPEFRLKQDVVPGKITQLVITPTIKGSYELRCAELCGMDHTIMTAWVDVLDQSEFEDRLKGEDW
jgi:cytochrome c oxidase subunit 2